MKAQPRQNGELSNGKKKTYHFYLPNELYDKLIKESASADINISKIVEDKLKTLDEIKFLILKNTGEKKE